MFFSFVKPNISFLVLSASQMDVVTSAANIFAEGVADSLSFHRTLGMLVNNQQILFETLRILGTNCVMLLGSVLSYKYLLEPMIASHFKEEKGLDAQQYVASYIYHSLWVVPIYTLLYLSSLAWYQQLAELAYRHMYGEPKKTKLKAALKQTIYSLLVWAVLYGAVQGIGVVFPLLLDRVDVVLQALVTKETSSFLSAESMDIMNALLNVKSPAETIIITFGVCPLRLVKGICYIFGLLGSSFLYGWYGFDYHWLFEGLDMDSRCDRLERHWIYHIGYGAIITFIMRTTSFLVGYGIYLALFPFIILLSTVSLHRPEQLYESFGKPPASLAIFHYPKQISLQVLHHVDKVIRGRSERKSAKV